MITISQIRAARALLNWTQGDLAKKCGLSLRALNSIERGLALPRLDNLRSIQETFERADIEFQEFDGVRRRTERLEILKFEGVHCMEQHLVDVVQSMQAPGEVLMSLGSEKKFTGLRAKTLDDYFAHLARHGITERGLVANGETFVVGRPSAYRWLSPEAFSQVAYVVYSDTVIFLIPKKPLRTILIRSPSMAEMFRRQFEFNWKTAETPWFAKRYKEGDPKEPWSSTKAAGAREWIASSRRFADNTEGR
ncbi:MAG: helix-turn-helix transcriptional regulator [Alphaproteobacteria bacterium]|nr:helix-turn-helix transcriptional regulator [Alphaproteobacteria bacterium]